VGDDTNSGDRGTSQLPPPRELVLLRANLEQCAELIERDIAYVDVKQGRLVHLPTPFVRQWMTPREDTLPVVVGISSLPIMLCDKVLIGHDCPPELTPSYGPWFDRRIGIIFDVPDELLHYLPAKKACTPRAVGKAMKYLCDQWLIDVATDYKGKCKIIACALSVIERMFLPMRPAFFLTAGQAATGKTTTAHMISMALRGKPAYGSPFGKNEEERRKAVLSYLQMGLAIILWDNIADGTQVWSAAIEAALTSEEYADRVLGFTEIRVVFASSIQIFTGNNIKPRSDMATRSLVIRLEVPRPDPENRIFRRGKPVQWTEEHRGEILGAMYTLLLGNPPLAVTLQPETRFKEWYELVGSAVENAAAEHLALGGELPHCLPQKISFKELFSETTAADERRQAVGEAMILMRQQWPEGIGAATMAAYLREGSGGALELFGTLGAATGGWDKINRVAVSSQSVTRRLGNLLGRVVEIGDEWLRLSFIAPSNTHKESGIYKVEPVEQQKE